MNKKLRIVLMYAVVAVLIVLAVVLVIAFKNKKQKEENKLYNVMNDVVKTYYKDYYYPNILDNDVEKAKSYKQIGITMSLNDLAKYKVGNEDSILSLFKNYRTGANCNYDKTKITIYPTDPYGSEDIRIEANIVCGF